MKKIIIGGLLLALIGLAIFKINKQRPKSQIVPDCGAKMVATNKVFKTFEGTPKSVDFSNFPEAKTYFTRITESVKKGVNFAGHYVLTPIGCGTDCVLFAIVDAKDGKLVAYDSGKPNYHLRNENSYFVLEPVFAGQIRKFYEINNDSKLELVCSEESKANMYGSPQL